MVVMQILGIARLFSKYLLSTKNFHFPLMSTIPFQEKILCFVFFKKFQHSINSHKWY